MQKLFTLSEYHRSFTRLKLVRVKKFKKKNTPFRHSSRRCISFCFLPASSLKTVMIFGFLCLDMHWQDPETGKLSKSFNSLTGIIFVWTLRVVGLVGQFFQQFQFPYGNYFCLDLERVEIPCSTYRVSIPLRELFLFGPFQKLPVKKLYSFGFNSLTGIIFVWT